MSFVKVLTVAIAFLCLINRLCALPLADLEEKDEEDSLINKSAKYTKNASSMGSESSSKISEESVNNSKDSNYYRIDDMLFPKTNPLAMSRSSILNTRNHWKDGVVPYEINDNYNFTDKELKVIHQAMEDFHQRTCIRFVNYTDEENYISIKNNKSGGCYAVAGCCHNKGEQTVNLGCDGAKKTVVHELMHALGFLHEQSRHDRDDYVTIKFENIKEDQQYNFDVLEGTGSFGVPYDYKSIMHYTDMAFSKNNKTTIIAKDPSMQSEMGHAKDLSENDVKRINLMYNCGEDI